jgi:hypothetical protein
VTRALLQLTSFFCCVWPFQAALELEPGNVEVAKQLGRAKLEDEEARKQRAVAKAISRGAAGGGVQTVNGLTMDLDKLGRVERLAAELAPPAAAPAASSSGAGGAEAAAPQLQANGAAGGQDAAAAGPSGASDREATANGAAPGRGPALPPRAKPGRSGEVNGGHAAQAAEAAGPGPGSASAPAGQGVKATCDALRKLLRDDDAACVYLRECGGLQHIAARVSACGAVRLSHLAMLPRHGDSPDTRRG